MPKIFSNRANYLEAGKMIGRESGLDSLHEPQRKQCLQTNEKKKQ